MTLEHVFSLCSGLAILGWLGLVLAPRWHITRDWMAPVAAPLMIGSVYIWLMANSLDAIPSDAGFGSLAGVTALYSVPELVLAGWVHYLVFDLFVGAWELQDSQKEGIHHLLVIPCLLLTLMAAPAGLVLYLVVKRTHRSARQSPLSQG